MIKQSNTVVTATFLNKGQTRTSTAAEEEDQTILLHDPLVRQNNEHKTQVFYWIYVHVCGGKIRIWKNEHIKLLCYCVSSLSQLSITSFSFSKKSVGL